MENKENKTGLDQWNERLDNNLEPERAGDKAADINAAAYSQQQGSGDQSDDPERMPNLTSDDEMEDNMAREQPKSATPQGKLNREE
ncbi:hypothetical protein [Pedobacter faecalis]|uniref:hypothetical protein n=1 Tax=Pedobacter faecalis TaxID=3041495 RepID=UPI002551BD0D|nr:hypothetical protein [Pedobacter sp. ELA7]